MIVDGTDIDVWPDEYEWAAPWQVEAHRTFIDVVKHVRGVVADADIGYVARTAGIAGNWPFGLFELLLECNIVGATVSDELLDEALESRDPDGAMDQVVAHLRARAREAASG